MPKPGIVPLIIVAGVQKGGSSSMRDLLSQQGLCHPATGELQFFNHECFAGRPIQEDEREAYFAEWHHCRAQAHSGGVQGLLGFDKSPATYTAVDTAARMPGAAASAKNPADTPRSGLASLQRLPPVRRRAPISAAKAPHHSQSHAPRA